METGAFGVIVLGLNSFGHDAAVVLLVDTVSARVRRRIISGHPEPGPVANFLARRPWQRALTVVGLVLAVAFVIFLLVQLETDISLV